MKHIKYSFSLVTFQCQTPWGAFIMWKKAVQINAKLLRTVCNTPTLPVVTQTHFTPNIHLYKHHFKVKVLPVCRPKKKKKQDRFDSITGDSSTARRLFSSERLHPHSHSRNKQPRLYVEGAKRIKSRWGSEVCLRWPTLQQSGKYLTEQHQPRLLLVRLLSTSFGAETTVSI